MSFLTLLGYVLGGGFILFLLFFLWAIITHESPTQKSLKNMRTQLDDMQRKRQEREVYLEAQRLSMSVGSRSFRTLKEYEDLCAQILELQKKCKKDEHYWRMVGSQVGLVEGYAGIAKMRGVPYHSPEVVAAAHTTLELAEGYKPKQLEAAIQAFRNKYSPERMKRERAPEAVRAEAAKRLSEAEAAYAVLTKEAAEKFSWST